MKVSSEFSKYAQHYGSYNVVQNMVADRLLSNVKSKPQTILDLGCGSGALVKKIDWDYKHFIGIDFAKGMLELHPKADNIECFFGDFNDDELFKELSPYKFDYILSASALQWADDLGSVFAALQKFNAPFALAIFTANTFKTLNETAGLEPLLRSSQEIEALAKEHFNSYEMEIVEYRLEFASTQEIFRYIKRSGVSGSRALLSYKETKRLMREYPTNSLEFEVAFIYSR